MIALPLLAPRRAVSDCRLVWRTIGLTALVVGLCTVFESSQAALDEEGTEDATHSEARPDVASSGVASSTDATRPDTSADANDASAPSARDRYNQGLAALEADDPEAATDAFLSARDAAGPDPELRFRAAYNLGIALAREADALAENPDDAIEKLRDSAAWFNDAIRLSPEGDDDARINLEVVMGRIQQLADQLNQDKGLETRLDRIIDDQRTLRDDVRRLLGEINATGTTSEPVGFQSRFEALAERERTLSAEASTIGDLAADELQNIENASDPDNAQPDDKQRVRAFQLSNLDRFLQRARQSLSDTRRRLRRLEGERSHRRADAALSELKRAREQLNDPVTVLKAIARDQLGILQHSAALSLLASSSFQINASESPDAPPARSAPPWLTAEHLTDRQEYVAMRTGEVLMRLKAGVDPSNAPQQKADAETETGPEDRASERIRQAAREAIPLLESAQEAMRSALVALPDEQWQSAAERQGNALEHIGRAIERFAGLRDLIELAYADQARVNGLLNADSDDAPPFSEYQDLARKTVADNLDRMDRLEALLDEEFSGTQSDPTENQVEDSTAAGRHQFAESLRTRTVAALEEMQGTLDKKTETTVSSSAEVIAHLEELRRMFFSLVEHIHELLAEQTSTHDETASATDAAIEALPAALGLVAERQAAHALKGDALAEAVSQQADAAANETEGPPGSAAEGVDLAQVVEELRLASGLMHAASASVNDAAQNAATMSPVLEPTLEDQQGAISHLEAAIALLQPPQEQQDQQQNPEDGQQDQPQASPNEQQEAQEQMSQRQALRRLQAIRDRDAQRQRDRDAEAAQRDPVEKDW